MSKRRKPRLRQRIRIERERELMQRLRAELRHRAPPEVVEQAAKVMALLLAR